MITVTLPLPISILQKQLKCSWDLQWHRSPWLKQLWPPPHQSLQLLQEQQSSSYIYQVVTVTPENDQYQLFLHYLSPNYWACHGRHNLYTIHWVQLHVRRVHSGRVHHVCTLYIEYKGGHIMHLEWPTLGPEGGGLPIN